MKIYLVEDERDLSEIVRKYLAREGYEVTTFRSGEKALEAINDKVDLWILDIMLEGEVDGYDLITKIHEVNKDASVIFTSARDQALDRIKGLEFGSDDYIPKPYSPRELLLRVKAILKRKQVNPSIFHYEDYTINIETRELKHLNESISLTNKEFDMLIILLTHRHTPVSRDDLIKEIWGPTYYGSHRVVDDLLRRVRGKLKDLRIETIYGFGYRLL